MAHVAAAPLRVVHLLHRPLQVVREEGRGGPLPHVARRLVQAEAVGLVAPRGRGPQPAVLRRGAVGEGAREGVGSRVQLLGVVPPGKEAVGLARARGVLPLVLGGQALAGPAAEGGGVVPGDVHGGVVAAKADVGGRALRVRPVGALHGKPPGARRHLRGDARRQPGLQQPLVHEGPPVPLRVRAVARLRRERREGLVGHLRGVDGEGVHVHHAGRALHVFGVGALRGAEGEAAALQEHLRPRRRPLALRAAALQLLAPLDGLLRCSRSGPGLAPRGAGARARGLVLAVAIGRGPRAAAAARNEQPRQQQAGERQPAHPPPSQHRRW
mmetsp:Transcript_13326/g.48506  ORF Transcript_13326/g.48506 Transcript_13326/m.48506 type:complete len:327 (+) Transcript_13326:309-1289(+)